MASKIRYNQVEDVHLVYGFRQVILHNVKRTNGCIYEVGGDRTGPTLGWWNIMLKEPATVVRGKGNTSA